MSPKALQMKSKTAESQPEHGFVTFYAWNEQTPSSVKIRISGGEQTKDGDGKLYRNPIKEAQFRLGVYATDDTEEIAEIRKLMAKGADITEDYAKFLDKTETDEKRASRAVAAVGELKAKNTSQEAEIERLRALLGDKA
jgi:hypothetical protein